jgi:UDP-N-acetylmuramoyl-L-alanyl-D-glutamate--2,6-diaminopimelate ligase
VRLADLLGDRIAGPVTGTPVDAEARSNGADDPDPDVDHIAIDSRVARPGNLFACVVGAHHDGHDHAADAVRAGAVAVLAERSPPGVPADVPVIIVPSVRAALGPLAACLAGEPSRAIAVVGVTGTNGKTTVTHLLESIGAAAGMRPAVLGTLGARWRANERTYGFTTPEAHELQAAFAAMRTDGVDLAAIEVSSHALDQHRVDGTRFAVVGFTNLSSEHLDLHGDLEAYFDAKARLFSPVFAERAVIALDDEWGRRMAERATAAGLDVTTVAVADASGRVTADLVATEIQARRAGTSFTLRSARADLEVALPLLGRFNVANALVAAGLARAVGIDDRTIGIGLAAVAPVPGRLELVSGAAPVTVVVDYAHTPHALEVVIGALRTIVGSGRVIVVYGCGGDRDAAKRPLMGKVVAERADLAVLTSDNPRGEDPEAIAADVLAGLGPADRLPEVELDRRRAIRRALEAARPGDAVLVAGKGHEAGQTAHGRTVPFDDRVVARDLLAELGLSA